MYISQDLIGLAGGNPTLCGYVSDTNMWVDILGLDVIRLRHYTSNKGLQGIEKVRMVLNGSEDVWWDVKRRVGSPFRAVLDGRGHNYEIGRASCRERV